MIDFVPWAENFIVLATGKPIRFECHQKRIFEHVFAFDSDGKLPYSLIVYSAPKKSGKTCIEAVVTAWWAYNIEAPNEIILAANKRDQAIARPFRELRGFIERNPALKDYATRITERQITLQNGTIVTAIPNDFAGEAGSNHGLTTWDELWAFLGPRDEKLWDELTPVPTRKNSIRFVGTYAGFEGESKLLEGLYLQVFDKQGNIKQGVERPLSDDFPAYIVDDMFVYWDHEPRMPWQTPEYYESQRKQLRPGAFLRLHENRWVSSEQGLFDMDKWDACVDPDHTPLLPDKSIRLWAGVDASVKKDRSAVVSVYKKDGKVRLGPKRFWQPTSADPMDLEETMEAFLLELYRGYTLVSVKYDPFQFHRSATTLAKQGLPMHEFPQSVPNLTAIGQNLYDLVQYGNIVLYTCKHLRYEASCAIGKDTGRGLRIVKEKSSAKIDQIIALAICALDCAPAEEFSGQGRVDFKQSEFRLDVALACSTESFQEADRWLTGGS